MFAVSRSFKCPWLFSVRLHRSLSESVCISPCLVDAVLAHVLVYFVLTNRCLLDRIVQSMYLPPVPSNPNGQRLFLFIPTEPSVVDIEEAVHFLELVIGLYIDS